MSKLKIMTECDEHGIETIEAEAVAIATEDGRLFTFGQDPESGGLIVTTASTSLAVGVLTHEDTGTVMRDTLVLMTAPVDIGREPGRLN